MADPGRTRGIAGAAARHGEKGGAQGRDRTSAPHDNTKPPLAHGGGRPRPIPADDNRPAQIMPRGRRDVLSLRREDIAGAEEQGGRPAHPPPPWLRPEPAPAAPNAAKSPQGSAPPPPAPSPRRQGEEASLAASRDLPPSPQTLPANREPPRVRAGSAYGEGSRVCRPPVPSRGHADPAGESRGSSQGACRAVHEPSGRVIYRAQSLKREQPAPAAPGPQAHPPPRRAVTAGRQASPRPSGAPAPCRATVRAFRPSSVRPSIRDYSKIYGWRGENGEGVTAGKLKFGKTKGKAAARQGKAAARPNRAAPGPGLPPARAGSASRQALRPSCRPPPRRGRGRDRRSPAARAS
jgi:hypothetical protein